MKETMLIGYKVVKVVEVGVGNTSYKLISVCARGGAQVRYKLHKAVEAPYACGDLAVFSNLTAAKGFHNLLGLFGYGSYRIYKCTYTKGKKGYLANLHNRRKFRNSLNDSLQPYARYAKSVTLLRRLV